MSVRDGCLSCRPCKYQTMGRVSCCAGAKTESSAGGHWRVESVQGSPASIDVVQCDSFCALNWERLSQFASVQRSKWRHTWRRNRHCHTNGMNGHCSRCCVFRHRHSFMTPSMLAGVQAQAVECRRFGRFLQPCPPRSCEAKLLDRCHLGHKGGVDVHAVLAHDALSGLGAVHWFKAV